MPIDYINIKLDSKEKLTFLAAAASIGAVVGILFYDSIIVSVAITLATFLLLPKYRQSCAERRRQELLIQFKDLLYSISASIASGRNMSTALAEAKDFCGATYEESDYIMRELTYMTQMIENGNETDTRVLADFAERTKIPDIEDFVSVYENCKGTGGNLRQAIHRASNIIGDKIEIEAELKSLMAQKLFESRIVGLSPFVIVFFVKLTAPDYMSAMTTTSTGRTITTFAMILIAASVWMTERINKIEI